MIIQTTDYNNAQQVIDSLYRNEWNELYNVITNMPLHLKASDQRGKQGTPIFDPVGTNQFIKKKLENIGWESNISIPKKYSFLGTDIDFGKNGMIVEAQFSNYPFLLNNTIRSELFYKSGLKIGAVQTKIAIIITKAHMFPSSNSTLYYEQAKEQLNELEKYGVFKIPIRLVGLFEKLNVPTKAYYTTYSDARYSRTVVSRKEIRCIIHNMTRGSLVRRCSITLDE